MPAMIRTESRKPETVISQTVGSNHFYILNCSNSFFNATGYTMPPAPAPQTTMPTAVLLLLMNQWPETAVDGEYMMVPENPKRAWARMSW